MDKYKITTETHHTQSLVCQSCGAIVGDIGLHNEWHRDLKSADYHPKSPQI